MELPELCSDPEHSDKRLWGTWAKASKGRWLLHSLFGSCSLKVDCLAYQAIRSPSQPHLQSVLLLRAQKATLLDTHVQLEKHLRHSHPYR